MFAQCDECGQWKEGTSYVWKAANLGGITKTNTCAVGHKYVGTSTIQTHRCVSCCETAQKKAKRHNIRTCLHIGLTGTGLVAIALVYDIVAETGMLERLSYAVLAPIVLMLIGLGLWAYFMNERVGHTARTRTAQRKLAQSKAGFMGLSVFSPQEYSQLLKQYR